MVLAILDRITLWLESCLRRMEIYKARYRHIRIPPPLGSETRYQIGKVFYTPCPCEADACLCRMMTREDAPCPECWGGLHIFDAYTGNPPPHRKRSPDLPCASHGKDCIWPQLIKDSQSN